MNITSAFVLSALFPALVFSISPLILGVAHIAGDFRYLVVRRNLPRGAVALIFAFCSGLLALRALETFTGARDLITTELYLGWGWAISMALYTGVTHNNIFRAFIGAAFFGTILYFALGDPFMGRLIFAHAHNLIGVLLWTLYFRRKRYSLLPPLLFLTIALGLIFSGFSGAIAGYLGTLSSLGLSLEVVSKWLAPGVSYDLALALTLSFTFLQAIHYFVWIIWVPQEETRGEGSLSFRMTVRSLKNDFRTVGLMLIVTGALLIPTLALFTNVHFARDTYLSLATFHGYLEVALLAHFFVRGFGPSPTETNQPESERQSA